ncbi:MAG: CoA transferase, partial [Ignavibacteriae bacterium]|nr:CoA transferase [Ignavibacteriota bacterium]
KSKKRNEWLKILSTADVPVGNINSLSEALQMKAVEEREMIVSMQHPSIGELKMVGNPIKLTTTKRTKVLPPPLLSQHTNEALRSLGYSDSDIKKLKRQKII